MFRLKLHWNDIVLTTETSPDLPTATAMLETLKEQWGNNLTALSIEQDCRPYGWIDVNEVETIQILARYIEH